MTQADEVHRSGADTYKKVIEYFNPKFLLGMSATPERTDGYDIYKTFDYNIAYEIRLNSALEENMLVPFHYYGVSDIQVDGKVLDSNCDFNKLICSERVEKIIHFAEFYGCDKGRVKGLVFCSRKEEAKELSNEFNKRGYRTIALDGDSSEALREESINRLELEDEDVSCDNSGNKNAGDTLDYIFTVDIFNEGVDIPAVNQIIMLRPTQSAIVFVQQLGRGLRKNEGKEYLTVIDFIGNYANNYLVPIALYGDNTYNKDNLRKLLNSGSSYIPGASTVNFDFITKQKIFESINTANLSNKKELVKDYNLLKYKLGRIPKMLDFLEHGSRDPYAYVEYSGSYYAFLSNLSKISKDDASLIVQLTELEMKTLEFYSKEVCNAKRIEEVIILKKIIENEKVRIDDFIKYIEENYHYCPSMETIKSSVSYLNTEFFKTQDQAKYGVKGSVIIEDDALDGSEVLDGLDTLGVLQISEFLSRMIKNKYFKGYLLDTINYAIYKFNDSFSKSNYQSGFLIYQKYSRKDVCRILNWDKDESSTIYGYRIKHNTCPIFVTYEKTEDISESTKYEDHFINNRQFNWMTRSRVKMDSAEVVQIKNYKSGLRISLFVKKSDSEGSDFYYMGDMEPFAFDQMTIKNDSGADLPIVNIKYNMQVPVDDNMLRYLES